MALKYCQLNIMIFGMTIFLKSKYAYYSGDDKRFTSPKLIYVMYKLRFCTSCNLYTQLAQLVQFDLYKLQHV